MSKQSTTERYFAVINPASIRARILPHGHDSDAGEWAQLKRISPVGAVLLLAEPPKIQGGCQLEIVSDRLQQPLLIQARIDWLRPDPAGSWHLRCAIEPKLNERDFRRLLDSGLLERRSSPREEARILVEIQLAPGGPRFSALIRNISLSGVCCLATNCPPEGTRHINIFATNDGTDCRIPLKVHWWTQAGSEYFLGCEFVCKNDFAVLRQLQLDQGDAQLVEAHARPAALPAGPK